MQPATFKVTQLSVIDQINHALPKSFTATQKKKCSDILEIYDTFDWRLYKSRHLLIKNNRGYELILLPDETIKTRLYTAAKTPFVFTKEMPSGDLKTFLEGVIKMRALIKVAVFRRERCITNLLNTDKKTVVRIAFETLSTDRHPQATIRCDLNPVRGYIKEYKQAISILKTHKLQPAKKSFFLEAIRKTGLTPGNYTAKFGLPLKPQMPTAQVVQRILAHQVDIMHRNESGIKDDIDIEFLHDFRVSVRRSRSLLGQLKSVFDNETTRDLQQHLRLIGGLSGNLRDLDVYLLKKGYYQSLVPLPFQDGINILFRSLKQKRYHALNRLRKAMHSRQYLDALNTLDEFVNRTAPISNTPKGDKPILPISKTVIYKRYCKVLKTGRKIDASTPDKTLHDLRIDCKKLRYLLEFFTSLFPTDDMRILIKQLKALQDNLGDFNDLSVQQEFLYAYLTTIKAAGNETVQFGAAIGALIASLNRMHQNVRREFLATFIQFCAPSNCKRYETLFAK